MDEAAKTRGADLSDAIGPLWRRRWLVLAVVAAATVGTFLIASLRSDRYQATASVVVETSTIQGILNQPPITTVERATADQAHVIASHAVAQRVIKRLGLDESPGSLLDDVSAAVVPGSDVVLLTAERRSPRDAAEVANAFVREFIDLGLVQITVQIDDAIGKARARLRTLQPTSENAKERAILRDGVARLRAAGAVLPEQGRQIDQASPPRAAVAPRPARDALFALIISTVLAITLVFALEWLSGRRGEQTGVGVDTDDAAGKAEPAFGSQAPEPTAVGAGAGRGGASSREGAA